MGKPRGAWPVLIVLTACFCGSVAFKGFPGKLPLVAAPENMAKVQVLNVAVLDNPSPFGNPFQFEITFECMEDLAEGWYHCLTAAILV